MKYVVLPTLARTKTCLLLKVIENEMNQSESAHSFCTALAPKQTGSLHLLKIPTEGGSTKCQSVPTDIIYCYSDQEF